jgi:hypothetical protein
MERDLQYENSNIAYDWQCPEGGIKCKNYIICESILPKCWFEYKGNYLCTNCHMMFETWGKDKNIIDIPGFSLERSKGILEISDNLECPICLENKLCISQARCDHSLCINCFKRCYYGDESREGEPIFPYDKNIEDEYEEDQDNPKWDIDYPLIKIYNEEFNKWDDERIEKYDSEEYLRKCPLCRKIIF